MGKDVRQVRRVIALNAAGMRIGETHHNATISDATVDQIRDLREDEGWTYARLAEHFGIGYSTIAKICTYERRAQTPERWKTERAAK